MPEIKEYTSPVDKLTPNDIGEVSEVRAGRVEAELGDESARTIARAVGSLGNVVKDYGEYAEKHYGLQEIVNGAATAAQLHASHQQYADNLFKDPANLNSPDVANQALANAGPDYDKFLNSFQTDTGKRWAAEQVVRDKQNLVSHVVQGQSALQGENVVNKLHDWINTTSSLVYRNPANMKNALDGVEPLVQSMIDNMPGATAEQQSRFRTIGDEAKLRIQEAGVYGMADKNPGAAMQYFDDYPERFDKVDGVKAHQVFDFMQRRNVAEARSAREDAEVQRRENNRAGVLDFLQSGTTDDAGHFTPKPGMLSDMIRGGKYGPEAIENMMHLSEKPDVVRSKAGLENSLIMDYMDGKIQDKDVISHVGTDLANGDAEAILRLGGMDRPDKLQYKETLDTAQTALEQDLFTKGKTLSGQLSLQKFTSWLQPVLEEGRKAGFSQAQMLDPNDPHYILKGSNIPAGQDGSFWNRFKPSNDEIIGNTIGALNEQSAPAQRTSFFGGLMSGASDFANRIMNRGERSGHDAVSPTGAQSEMQVLPSTQGDPGFGIRPADPALGLDDVVRVGKEYADKMKEHYDGNETLAAVAYNRGPGQVDAWLAKYGDPRKDPNLTNEQWLNQLPADARAYAHRVTGHISQADINRSMPFDQQVDTASKVLFGK